MQPATRPHNHALPIILGGIICAVIGTSYGIHVKMEARRDQEQQQAAFQKTMGQLQQQLQTMQERMTAQENRPQNPPAAPAPAMRAVAKRSPLPTKPRPMEDPRVSQLEKKLSAQDQKLDETQRMVDSTRGDLEGRINSTSDELHGSIARTSEEVAALRRRGERDYVEFDLTKSKELRRAGQFNLALRKTDTKHKRYNLDLLVDDNRVEKKNVNLLEPIFITFPEWPQPVELVVNRIDKDRVKGYISTPKYSRAQLAAAGRDEASPGR